MSKIDKSYLQKLIDTKKIALERTFNDKAIFMIKNEIRLLENVLSEMMEMQNSIKQLKTEIRDKDKKIQFHLNWIKHLNPPNWVKRKIIEYDYDYINGYIEMIEFREKLIKQGCNQERIKLLNKVCFFYDITDDYKELPFPFEIENNG